ncbi:hypothetical protein R1sor_009904 [Riccia sorocarpa]|uniref:Replitron HUH endonuclease domain-containing protein n=1 Tax=Riccia sorocarpa TaxID=122646 RepID=A0ABD3HWQ7_9MARC
MFFVVKVEPNYVLLSDRNGKEIYHTKWFVKQVRGQKFYNLPPPRSGRTTASVASPTRLKQKARAKKATTIPEAFGIPSPQQNAPGPKNVPQKKKSEAPKSRRVPPKQMDVSLTVGQVGADVEATVFDKLALYIEREAKLGLIAFERDDTNLQLHIQGVMTIVASSVRSIKIDILKEIGWDVQAPVGGVVCVKSVKNQGLHTVTRLIGYCLKDEDQDHFRMYCTNVTEQQMEEGKKRHILFGASGYKNRLELSLHNLLGRALQFRRYRCKNPLSLSFRGCIQEMIHSGQYLPALKWVVMPTVSKLFAERKWLAAVSPEAMSMADIDHVFFNVQQPERYYSEHGMEEMFAEDRQPQRSMNPNERTAAEIPANDPLQPPQHSPTLVDSPWTGTDHQPVEFLEVDLDKMSAEEVKKLLNAGYGLTHRTQVTGEENEAPTDAGPSEEYISFL